MTDAMARAQIRRELYELMENDDVEGLEKQRRALSLGREFLDVENGHIQRPNDDGATDEVLVSVGEEPSILPEGATLQRGTTYCRRTLESHSPIALSNASEQGWADDPAFLEHGFECYLGTTIIVDGEPWGTVCFISRKSRDTDFTAEEQAFVELVARLLGRDIDARRYESQVEASEQARQLSEEKYETLIQLAPYAVFLVDAGSTEIDEVNEQAVEISGYGAGELSGMSVLDLHPQDDRDRYAELFATIEEKTQYVRFDDDTPLVLERGDGARIPIEMSVSRVQIEGSEYLLELVRDISSRRERELELERAREFLKRTQEVADIGGWEIDVDAGTLQWSDEVYRIHGLPLDYDPTPEDALEFYHPADRDTIRTAVDRLTEAGEPYDLELRIVQPDQTVRWVNAIGRPVYDDDGDHVERIRGVFQDITERLDRENDLRVKNRAMEESTVGITIGDASEPDIPIMYANQGFVRLTGYSKDRILGDNCRFLQGEDTDEGTIAELRNAIDAEEPVRTEILNYRADGTPFWNKLTVAPVTGEDGGMVTHFVGIQEDVTEQKRRDRLIEVLNRVLRHNLRNDMNVIGGFATAIADETDGNPAQFAAKIQNTTNRLIGLSEKARKFQSTVQATDSPRPRDVLADVRSVVTDLEEDYPDIEFAVEAEDNEEVMATESLRLAFAELGENAAKHGGSSPVVFRVETAADGDMVVRVIDEGPGLPEMEQQVLEAGRETPLAHGSGLGLWLVNWIVSGLGGEVSAAVGDGTSITVRLPTGSEDDGSKQQASAMSTRTE